MKKCLNLNFLQILFVGLLIMSNILSSKILSIGIYMIPGGILCYAITFLVMDVINEIFGQQHAKDTMLYGLITQVVCMLLLQITIILPSENVLFNEVLSINIWLTIASLISYTISQLVGIKLFHKIKDKTKHKWIYENLSTIMSHITNSLIFIGVGFGFCAGYGFNILLNMFVCQVITKIIIALIDTPFFYLIIKLYDKNKRQNKKEKNYV